MEVLYRNKFFLQLHTWFLYLICIGIFCVLCCFILLCYGTVLSVTVFFCDIVLFIVIYCSVFCSLLRMYCFIFDSTYCTLALPLGVNPITANKYLSIITADTLAAKLNY